MQVKRGDRDAYPLNAWQFVVAESRSAGRVQSVAPANPLPRRQISDQSFIDQRITSLVTSASSFLNCFSHPDSLEAIGFRRISRSVWQTERVIASFARQI